MDIIDILKEVADRSSEISGWALAVGAGTVAAIVGTSHYRPASKAGRLIYLLFIPGWVCIGISLYFGNKLSGNYLAAIMVSKEEIQTIASRINDAYAYQRDFLLFSLAIFGVWLLLYTLWWIFFMPTDERNHE